MTQAWEQIGAWTCAERYLQSLDGRAAVSRGTAPRRSPSRRPRRSCGRPTVGVPSGSARTRIHRAAPRSQRLCAAQERRRGYCAGDVAGERGDRATVYSERARGTPERAFRGRRRLHRGGSGRPDCLPWAGGVALAHWRASPLVRSPPPSTAWMPRPRLRTARFLVSVLLGLPTTMAARPSPKNHASGPGYMGGRVYGRRTEGRSRAESRVGAKDPQSRPVEGS